jgi:leader peptidase (prepilin peptidase)/N-methyltransferase
MLAVLFFIFGLVMGSFLNVCIYRIPLEKSIVFPPSSCTVCNSKIKWYDNIPILSYILLGGKCRNCKHKISPIYPTIEAISGILTLLIYLEYGLSLQSAAYLIFTYALIVGSFIDLKYYIIPDRISLGLIVAGLLFSYFLPIGLKWSFIGAASGFIILYLVAIFGKLAFKKDAMGGGDIKLLSGIGAFLGIKGVLFTLFFSSFLGSFVGIALILLGKKELSSKIPFGPYLSLAALCYIFFGSWLIKLIYGV